ncbi:hypothetical protein MTR62_15620, partial [Novosphingobium sp. 1949]|nr:hypothetical protein [Novosphingobium organovorum]
SMRQFVLATREPSTDDGRCESDPCRDIGPALRKPPPTRHRPKVSARDLPAFYARLNGDDGARLSHLALRWTILTMVRTQETDSPNGLSSRILMALSRYGVSVPIA